MLESRIPKEVRHLLRKFYNVVRKEDEKRRIKILLLTNRDSDNLGDQLIEACDISLIHTVMQNLGYLQSEYKIHSSAAGIVPKQYLKTNDESLLENAREKIKGMDLLIFGGAPLFNYAYQTFYKRTIITLQLAEEYGVPVLFSAIGVETYSETNPKCQQLKAALNLPCVKQITTRDDLDSLEKYVTRKGTRVARVTDPAVFADKVFELHQSEKRKGTIGLVAVRSQIFKDNHISFSEAEQMRFWVEITEKLSLEGYGYEFLTTGHFTDEVFLENLCREHNISINKCKLNMNVPEDLTKKISSYDGVIAYRLHANITAYAFDVPAVGLTWNPKVSMFYEQIGCPERAFAPQDWNPEQVVAALKKAISEGVSKDQKYIMSVYDTLFASMKEVFQPDTDAESYTYAELQGKLSRYQGTGLIEKIQKLRRKRRRILVNQHKLKRLTQRRV